MTDVGDSQLWEQLKLTWEARRKAPCVMKRGVAVAHGRLAYFNSPLSNEVFTYDSEKDNWSELPKCPQINFRLEIINNFLTAIGGMSRVGGECIDRLISFNGSEWVKIFPPMLTKRHWHTVMCMQKHLIVVAGETEGGDVLSTVEVMNTDTLEWYTAARLPEPAYLMSATVCGGRLYLLGAWDKNGNPTHAVFTCTLESLIRSCHPPSQTPPHTSEASVWQRVADVPVVGSVCVTLNGKVLSISGRGSDGNPIAEVHMYNAKSDLWSLVGRMLTLRSDCLVLALHNRVIAVGGSTESGISSTVELGGEGAKFHLLS